MHEWLSRAHGASGDVVQDKFAALVRRFTREDIDGTILILAAELFKGRRVPALRDIMDTFYEELGLPDLNKFGNQIAVARAVLKSDYTVPDAFAKPPMEGCDAWSAEQVRPPPFGPSDTRSGDRVPLPLRSPGPLRLTRAPAGE